MSKNTFNRLSITFTLILMGWSMLSWANGSGQNRKDDQGRRQGYWVIQAYMTNEPSFAPEAVVEEGGYVDDKREGPWKRYYPNGKLKSEITYINDRPNGAYTVYYENGKVEEKGNWARNKNTGEFSRYHENGKPQQEFFFNELGIRNGVQRYYHANGQLELEVTVIDGKEDGVMRRWDENGKLIEEKSMHGGILVPGGIKRYDKKDEAEIVEELAIPNSPKTTSSEDSPNSAHKFDANGHNTLYNQSKQVTQTGEFKNGRLWNGKWYRYDANGILQRVEIYKAGRYIGDGVLEEEEK